MPWKIVKGPCPDSKPYGIINTETGKLVPGSCHSTQHDTYKMLQALYANEPGAAKKAKKD